jgi:hypothetical protein
MPVEVRESQRIGYVERAELVMVSMAVLQAGLRRVVCYPRVYRKAVVLERCLVEVNY